MMRGLFRLWLVSSGMWLVGLTFLLMEGRGVTPAARPPGYGAERQRGQATRADRACDRAAAWSDAHSHSRCCAYLALT